MTGMIAFYVGLTAATWACIWPMLRMPAAMRSMIVPRVAADVPNTTFDFGGLA